MDVRKFCSSPFQSSKLIAVAELQDLQLADAANLTIIQMQTMLINCAVFNLLINKFKFGVARGKNGQKFECKSGSADLATSVLYDMKFCLLDESGCPSVEKSESTYLNEVYLYLSKRGLNYGLFRYSFKAL